METTNFDVLVIGTGEGGTTAAQKCAKAGKRVAIVDVLPFGGTCALRGCDPKKVLIGAAETVARSRQLLGHGLDTAATVAWADLMRFKNSFTGKVPAAREASLQKASIATYHGLARFTGPTRCRSATRSYGPSSSLSRRGRGPALSAFRAKSCCWTVRPFWSWRNCRPTSP